MAHAEAVRPSRHISPLTAALIAVICILVGALGMSLLRLGTSASHVATTPDPTPAVSPTPVRAPATVLGTAGRITLDEDVSIANGWYRGPYEKAMFGVEDSPTLSDVWYKEKDGYLMARFLVASKKPYAITSVRVEHKGDVLERPTFRCIVNPGQKVEVVVRTPAPTDPNLVIAPVDLLVGLASIEPV